MTDNNKTIEGLDKDGNTVKVLIRMPTPQDYRDSQLEYNKAFRKALDSGALLRQKLSDYMEAQGIWDEEKEKKNQEYIKDIQKKEEKLKGGGIRLSEAKQIAIELKALRDEFRSFLAEKNSMDSNSAEGQADNARFSELVRLCTLNPSTEKPWFPNQSDYDASSDQPWVVEAASELASMIYGLDPDYDNSLEENKFLKEFNFINEDLRYVDSDGHLTDVDGRLVNEEGRFIAYRTEQGKKNQDKKDSYFVNREGEEVVLVVRDGKEAWVKKSLEERKPFLDDEDQPIAEKKETPTKRKKKTTSKEDAETAS